MLNTYKCYINQKKKFVLRFKWVLVGKTCDSSTQWQAAVDVDQTPAFARIKINDLLLKVFMIKSNQKHLLLVNH